MASVRSPKFVARILMVKVAPVKSIPFPVVTVQLAFVRLLRITATAVANLSLTGGTITLIDPHAGAGTSDYVVSISQGGAYNSASAAHTFKFGNGVSTDVGGNANGFYYYLFPGSFYYGLGNVLVDAVSTTIASNRVVKSTSSIPIAGNLTVISGEYWVNSTTFIAGNIVNNGILTTTSTATLSGYNATGGIANTAAQTVSGSGTFRNLQTSPTASMASLTVNNSNATGVTLSVPLSISSTFTHTLGLVNTSAASVLQIGTATVAAAYTGTVGTTNHIVGPLARTFPSSRAIGTYVLFYTGKGGVYAPISVDLSTSAVGPVIVTAESFATNTGSAGSGVSNK